jgi:UDP-N-acetyl-D-mannosaminuronic acid transferase (WecB/TagA/CpsF family)
MRSLGVEWLWRLAREPWRAKRIWKSTVVFFWKILANKKIPADR